MRFLFLSLVIIIIIAKIIISLGIRCGRTKRTKLGERDENRVNSRLNFREQNKLVTERRDQLELTSTHGMGRPVKIIMSL